MRLQIIILLVGFGLAFSEPVELLHSDVMESYSGGEVVVLRGSVKLRHLGRGLLADFARWDRRRKMVSFDGNVTIIDTGYTIFADNLVYHRRGQRAEARGNVRYFNRDSTLSVSGETGFYSGEDEFVKIAGKPHLTKIDTTGSVLELDSRTLSHFISKHISVAVGSVQVTITPADSTKSPIKIFCDSLEYHQDSNFVAASGNVRIVQDSLTIRAPQAGLWRSTGNIRMFTGVSIADPNWRIWADTLFAKLSEGKLTSVKIVGNPRGLWHDPADTNRITQDSRFSADEMIFSFQDGKITLAKLLNRATVDYFPAPADTVTIERHITSGDSIDAIFADGKIDSVEVFGGVRGTSYKTTPQKRDSILYSGEMMALSQAKRIHLYQNAFVRYGTMQLRAGQIHFDGDVKVLVAHPLMMGDSLVGEPFLLDEKDSLRATGLAYNVETKRGKLAYGRTAADKGFFTGEQVAKAQGDTFYIRDATFTTCDKIPPHYHFFTPKLKLIPRDKAVVQPVWMYIGRLPIFWLPYFVFSVKPKRHSGILTMDIGKFQQGQRFVRNLGYYLVINDYLDVYAALDIDEEQGIYLKGEVNYALRYHFSGKVFASYKLTSRRDWDEGLSVAKRWELRANHYHNIGERGKFSSNISRVSDASYLTETEEDPYARMDRTLRSYGAFTQSFDWGSFSISIDRTENLDDGTISLYLPKSSLRKYSSAPFGNGEKWYNKFYISANTNAVGYSYTDTLSQTETHYGADANSSLTWSYSFGDYLTISPSASARGVVMDKSTTGEKLPALATYSLSTSASTDLYGNIPLGILGVKYFHHIISPSLTFGYSPDVEGSDRFYSTPGISVPSGQKSAYMKVDISQQFGLKISDSTGTISKISLFSTSTGFSYNFIADEKNFSDITTSLRANPTKWLSITASLVHTLYSGSDTSPTGLYPKSANLNSSANFNIPLPFPDEPRQGNISIAHYLSQDIVSGNRTQTAKLNLNTYITPRWKVGYNFYYDIEQMKKVSDEFHIWRDLHCWEITFIWVPDGIRAGYYFRINIKEIPEIKVERTEGGVKWR